MRPLSAPRRPGAALALAASAIAAGCTHNTYYYGEGATPAYVVPGSGSVIVEDGLCALPGRVISGSGRVISGSGRIISGGGRVITDAGRAIVAEAEPGTVVVDSGAAPTAAEDTAVVRASQTPSRVVISRPTTGLASGWSPQPRGPMVTTEAHGDAAVLR